MITASVRNPGAIRRGKTCPGLRFAASGLIKTKRPLDGAAVRVQATRTRLRVVAVIASAVESAVIVVIMIEAVRIVVGVVVVVVAVVRGLVEQA